MVAYYESPIGLLEIRADQRKLGGIRVVSEAGEASPNEVTDKVIGQLKEYFDGKRQIFSLFFIALGTEFQREVWLKMSQIPYGKVVTYGQLAAELGNPNACRAVAQAVGQNPFLILLPCHRVVAADGLGGFAAGTEAKRRLLAVEGVEISENQPIPEKFLFTFA